MMTGQTTPATSSSCDTGETDLLSLDSTADLVMDGSLRRRASVVRPNDLRRPRSAAHVDPKDDAAVVPRDSGRSPPPPPCSRLEGRCRLASRRRAGPRGTQRTAPRTDRPVGQRVSADDRVVTRRRNVVQHRSRSYGPLVTPRFVSTVLWNCLPGSRSNKAL